MASRRLCAVRLGLIRFLLMRMNQELVSIAEALKAEEVMLVHGDPSARHSLATALRQRGKRVISPKIGQTEVFKFKKRPWALGRVKSGNETRSLEPSELWQALKGQAGSFFSSRELAQMWWGDAERAEEVVRTLDQSVYFSADWRRKNTFQVLTEEQVIRAQRRRAIMMANPDIIGKLIVLRDVNNRPRVGVVLNASIDAFEADVHNAKGRHYPADALLWVIGQWEGYSEKKGKKAQLSELVKAIKPHQDTILPFVRRQRIVLDGKPVNPESLLPEALPEGITRQAALVSVVLSLAADGAVVEQDGLLPRRAIEGGPIEQNQAREIAFRTFPAEARLRKVGMEFHRKRLVLTVDFPDTVQGRFAEIIEQVEELTGWDVFIKPGVNQQALSVAVDELMPENAYIVKGPSFYMDKKEVGVDIGNTNPEALEAMERDYLELTGFRLITSKQVVDDVEMDIAQPRGGEKLEINAAYGIIRDALNPFGLLKTSLKQGQIVLTFISPQVGERHRNIIKDLAEETGYAITVHPHPNQQKISQIATSLIRGEGWVIRKGPGIHVDRAEVTATLNELRDEGAIESVMAEFEEQTGYNLVLNS